MTQQANPHEKAGVLVARAKAGDDKAFDELVRLYRPRICALALHLTSNESDAEDITQDVFLKAYRALPSFEGRSQFFTWVYRMAVNRSLNARRDRSRRERRTVSDDPRVDRAVAVDAAGDPVKAAELRRTYARLLAALDGLSPSIRSTVVLVSLQELSYGEAAIILNCSPGTVAWRMHVARDQLRKALTRPRLPTPPPLPKISTELSALMQACGLPIIA